MSDQPPVHPLIQSLGTADNPIHVISRPQQLTGWSGVQAGVDEFDKQEIDGHKDDMDSLLVFTGLFSAVLAAFVIIAYGLLQGGTTGSMLFVMSHTSVQAASYTIQGDYINSTTPAPTSPPPTEPTHNAIVVNILWNASLVVSLATASFAILVKQWLRQYTTFTTSFAMNRMRIRHFRRNGLEKWQVLGISSFLPFLLQIALGLFFVGLCYFTADVHPSVKNTTLPLVSAWAFLYISATICPVFSAHCPYKIPALDTLTTLTRNRLRRFYETVLQNIQAGNGRNAAGASTTANTTSRPAHIPVPSTVQRWAKRCLRRLNDKTRPYDETAAIATNTSDLDILLDADRLHGNDEVLDAAISHAIHQSKILPADAIPFTQQLIRNRIPTNVPFVNQPRFIDLLHLTPRAGAAVHNILDYMEWSDRDLGDGRIISFLDCIGRAASPERWAFFLRLSLSLAHPPITLPRWLDRCDSNSCHMLGRICQRSNSVQVLRSLLKLLCRRFEQRDFDLRKSLSQLTDFLEVYFEALDIPDWFTPNQVSSSSWDLVLNHESLGPTIAWLVRRLGLEIATPAPGSSNNHSHETTWADAASLIIKLMAITGPPQRSHDIQDLVLRSSEVLQRYWISCFRLQLPNRFFIPRENIDPEGLSTIRAAIAAFASDLPPEIDGQRALRLCHVVFESLVKYARNIRASKLALAWRGVFAALTQLVQRTQGENPDALKGPAAWCFRLIARFDGVWGSDQDVTYTEWRAMYKPEDSLIPDEFISALLRIDPNTGIGGWRVRRLKEMSAQNGDQAEEEVSPHSVEVFGTRSSEDKDGQLQSDDPKSAAAIKNAEVNTVPLSPDSIDGLRAEDQTLLPMRHGDTGAESTPVTKHGPMDAQSEAVVDEAICFADATAPRRTQASSTDDHTNRDEELCSPVHTLDATSHNVSCLDDIVVAGSLQAIQLENGDEGNSLASSSGRFVAVFEPSGSHAGAGTDSGETRSYGAMASTLEPSSYGAGSKVDLPPESARLERMHEELRDVHPTAIVYGQQVTDPGSLSISNIRGTVDTRGTRDEERVVSTAYSEPKHDVEWEGDAEGGESQYRGRESVVSREGMEEEDGAVDM